MAIEIVCSWQTLMTYAKEVGQAKKSGDPERIAEAEARHEDYRQMCLKADRMVGLQL